MSDEILLRGPRMLGPWSAQRSSDDALRPWVICHSSGAVYTFVGPTGTRMARRYATKRAAATIADRLNNSKRVRQAAALRFYQSMK